MYKLDRVKYEPKQINNEEIAKGVAKGLLGGMFEWFDSIMTIKDVVKNVHQNSQSKKDVDKIIFNTDALAVIVEGEHARKIPFREIQELVISYHQNLYDIPEEGEPSKIEFTLKNKESITVYFTTIHYTFNQLLRELYNHEVNLKEFKQGRRAFMGNFPKYDEIQEMKEQYPHIEW